MSSDIALPQRTQPRTLMLITYCTIPPKYPTPYRFTDRILRAYTTKAAVMINKCGREWNFPLAVVLRSPVKRPNTVAGGGSAPGGSSRQSSPEVSSRPQQASHSSPIAPDLQQAPNPLGLTGHTGTISRLCTRSLQYSNPAPRIMQRDSQSPQSGEIRRTPSSSSMATSVVVEPPLCSRPGRL